MTKNPESVNVKFMRLDTNYSSDESHKFYYPPKIDEDEVELQNIIGVVTQFKGSLTLSNNPNRFLIHSNHWYTIRSLMSLCKRGNSTTLTS